MMIFKKNNDIKENNNNEIKKTQTKIRPSIKIRFIRNKLLF